MLSPEERIKALEEEVRQLRELLALVLAENAELKRRLGMNSHNSHKPPSSDGLQKKPRVVNQRKKGKNRQGGQKGHKGSTLQMVEVADEIEELYHSHCTGCGSAMDLDKEAYLARQVFDLPEIKLEVTEYRSYLQQCNCCGRKHQGIFPDEINSSTQYGVRMKSFCTYLNTYQFIPFKRVQEMVADICGHRLSTGSLVTFNQTLHDKLAGGFGPSLKALLLKSTLLHADETAMRGQGRTNWVHVLGNSLLTSYFYHPKRGRKAMDEMGVLPNYRGTLIHDRLASYFSFDRIKHGLCNAHLLRELIFLSEEQKLDWADQLLQLLLQAKQKKDEDQLRPKTVTRIVNKFKKLLRPLRIAMLEKEAMQHQKGSGRPKRSRAENLINALEKHRGKFLLFLSDPQTPFDNNLAERDLRMIKVKQKVSGCFRSAKGGESFCMIRSYLSTLRKHQQSILQQIQAAFQNAPFIPDWG